MKYSPILIITYSRFEHLKKTILSLSENYKSDQHDLFIASDYWKNESDKKNVELIREYIKKIKGFKSVNIIEREKNYGALENYLEAKKYIFTKYEDLIFLEDDNVTGKYFLDFVNRCLNLYKNNNEVFAVSGYLFPIKHIYDEESCCLKLPYVSGWGIGLWKNKSNYDNNLYNMILGKLSNYIIMNFKNPNCIQILKAVKENLIDAEDAIFDAKILLEKKYCIFPSQTLVRNIGTDGSGLRCGIDHKYSSQKIYMNKIDISIVKNMDLRMRLSLFKYFGGWKRALINMIRYYKI